MDNDQKKADDNCLYSWQYNVRDEFKSKTTEKIRQHLKATCSPFAVLMTQIRGDYNFGSIIRSANNEGASKVFYYGPKRHYDKRLCCGTYNYTDVIYLSTLDQIRELKSEYRFVALENNIERKVTPLPEYTWPNPKSLILLGEESAGLQPDILDMCDDYVEIPSHGSVRSLNASVAASLAMYDYVCKQGRTIC